MNKRATLNKIMMIEDDPDIQEIAKLALEVCKEFQVLACSSGYEALDKIDDYQPDIILLDIMMPGMDGITTFHKLRKINLTKDTPVIFMSAKVQNHEVEEYYRLGALGVIAKPFDPMNLATIILEYWKTSYGQS